MNPLIDDVAQQLRDTATGRFTRARVITLIALSLITLQLAFRAWALYGGWFFGDDFVFLSDVARGQADLGWFFHRHNVHFMPLGFVLVLPVAWAGGFTWPAAATEILLVQALASFSCWWMLRTLFGNRLRILVPLTFFLFSAISMPAIMWWAAALNMLTVQPFIFAAITTHVLYLRHDKRRHAIFAALFFALGLTVYLKALLIPVVLVIVTLCYFAEGTFLTRVVSALRRFWFVWVLYLGLGLAFLAGYILRGGIPQDSGKVDYLDLIQRSVIASLGTGLLGGPWEWTPASSENGPRSLADPAQLLQTLSIVVIILLLIYVASRYRGALKPLWFLVPCIVFTVGLLARGRVATFGTGITMEIRYWADILPYFTLGIALMIAPLKGAIDPLRRRAAPILTVSLPRWFVAGFAAAFVTGAIFSSIMYVRPWHTTYDARGFVQLAESDLTRLEHPVQVADEAVPESVQQSITFPYNLTSYVFAPLNDMFDTPLVGNDLYVVNGFGQVVPGVARPDVVVPEANLDTCLIGRGPRFLVGVDLGARTYDYPFWISVTYRADTDADLTVVAGANRKETTMETGLHTLFVRTAGSYDRVAFAMPQGAKMCIDSLHVGQVVVPR
ncbi:MAG: hypothetical protein JWP10_883 [Nocardioidaceae bacterium]|nr:hypothetical protein [Nocardioidaceae bacterium]